ncbi:Hypothetical predicted protein [Mytilus galloprovincialis]|uniref:SGNH hydrolase-type esterase domain-containing protein n=1 Tax=Mytilus galloprovincialis TaxID=29158 RepID=A0A8B6BJ43_MYTGA|nr:Hypothetical predicted protein [Mytilus galloprovincialis]
MMEGVNRTRPKIRDSRLPITKELLLLIVKILPFICSSSYEVKLFQAAFSLAYHGLLRIGELAVSNGKSAHIISISDVSWSSFGVLNIRVPSSKTDQLGKPAKIWITGSSLVKNAFIESRQRPGGTNLCLDRLNAEIWWQGKSGMVTSQLRRQIRIMKKYEDPPKFLVVHVGANDLGNIKTKDLREKLIQAMTFISKDLPDTKIVWSQMLPRLKWRYSNDSKAMEKCRYRVNNAVANFILESGGYYIRYPDISRTENMYKSDGVHLSVIGNNIFLNSIQGGLEFFMLKTNGHVFPSTDI